MSRSTGTATANRTASGLPGHRARGAIRQSLVARFLLKWYAGGGRERETDFMGKAMEIPQIVRTYIETFTRDDLDTWIATFAPDGTYSDPNIPKPVPAHGLKEHFVGFFSGFPDGTCELVGVDAISERVWLWRWIFHGPIPAPSEAFLRQGAA